MKRTVKSAPLVRSLRLTGSEIDEESRTVSLAFSSTEPVERCWGTEILDHAAGSVRMDRIADSGPLLVEHNTGDQVGVVDSVELVGNVGRAEVRFGKSARAEEIFQDVKDDIRKHVSVQYRIHKMVLEESSETGDVFRVTDWEPLEISIVAVPADHTVGVGRSAEGEKAEILIDWKEDREMPVKDEPPKVEDKADNLGARSEPAYSIAQEEQRADAIRKLGKLYDADDSFVRSFITSDKSPDQFRAALRDQVPIEPTGEQRDADIGLTNKEVRQFSFCRAINALSNPTDRRAQEEARFEFEAGQAAAEALGKESRGIMVPNDVLKRDLTVGTATAGGHTVSTDLLAASFIDLLRNRAVVMSRATSLTGLVGNIAIPRQAGGATAYWVAESGAPTESQQAFDQVPMSPNTVGAFTDISRKLMIQSSLDIEAFVRMDLATTVALEIDRVCINGSGSGDEPEGILNTTGIGSVPLGTNGAALTWDSIIDLETEVAADNADLGSLAYVTNSRVRGSAKKTFIDAGSGERIWDSRAGSTPLNGYEAAVTNQVPSALTKGSGTALSAILFGNWADLIVGMWGGLDLMVDPYTASTSGTIRVVVLQDVDTAVRHPESFAAIVDAVTT